MTGNIGFSAKLKGAFGMSKIKETVYSTFQSHNRLIDNVQVLVKQDTLLMTKLESWEKKTTF